MLAPAPRPEKPSEMAARIERELATRIAQARAAGASDPAEIAFNAMIAQEFSTPRPGVKPWRYLSCGCRTDGRPCAEHDLTLGKFLERAAACIR